MRRYPFVVYILSVISLPLLPILDIIFMNIGSRTEQEWKDHVDIGPVRRFFGDLASLGIVKDAAIWILLGILVLIGCIMSFVFLASKKTPDEDRLQKLLKTNLITQIITTLTVSGLAVFSVLCLLTIFTFAISFVIWIFLALLAILGGIQTLPLYNDMRKAGKISAGQQVALTLLGGFFYLALIAAIAALILNRNKKTVLSAKIE